jgi:hypothetical protein
MKKKKSAHELFNWYSEGQREKKTEMFAPPRHCQAPVRMVP